MTSFDESSQAVEQAARNNALGNGARGEDEVVPRLVEGRCAGLDTAYTGRRGGDTRFGQERGDVARNASGHECVLQLGCGQG